jgi:hypothetical protein
MAKMERIDNEYKRKIPDIAKDFHVDHLLIYLKSIKFIFRFPKIEYPYQLHFYIADNQVIILFELMLYLIADLD